MARPLTLHVPEVELCVMELIDPSAPSLERGNYEYWS